jgi:hypothetical protein
MIKLQIIHLANRKINGSSCSNTEECQDYNGLQCTSGKCLCEIEKYWNGTFCGKY